ncbi:MAG: hypothetical protein FD152_213 [Xanthobacteraceae bacterium]|nr:MAG: hypothetical protein FD152_213 [Xanthobacteraceae bacterium]
MGSLMFASWSRSFLLLSAIGLLGACDELMLPPQEEAPVAAAPVVAAPVKKVAPVAAPAPVKTKPKPVLIDFGEGGSGGGGWN